ncbi:GNAT family N-acetyltransferase [Cellulomonas sp. SG140]|uniref:GNAT family N-acetyltransferase n=1 Tax=Cellulomonas sp. SG140 TaxID=2976536 RepID=UPI003994E0A1
MVEVGYEVVPWARRRGYARAALGALLAVAQQRADVQVLRATISAENTASRALVASFGLVEVGEQWDDEDGLETIFELPVV